MGNVVDYTSLWIPSYFDVMVYTGKPSAGCENCRKAKKSCDQQLPACGRCIRLGKACGGYRDLSDLIFKNETASVTRRASSQSEPEASGASVSSTRPPSPEKGLAAKQFFNNQFVTPSHLSFLDGVSPDEFLLKPIMACALATMANRNDDQQGRELARRYYVDALTATNTALRHPRRVKEDNTLVSVCLLSVFERLAYEPGHSQTSWRHHIEGSAQVLHLRGRSQIRTRTGAALFRELRGKIVNNALMEETEVPPHIVQWTQALEYDPVNTPCDELDVIGARMSSLRAAFRTGSMTDAELSDLADTVEKDLLAWSETTLAAGSICSFHNVRDLDSPHAWNGTRHDYGIPQAHRHWNKFRSLRILLSRTQEALWRRSWPVLAQPSQPVPDQEHYRGIRNRMVADICIAAAYALGNDLSAEPTRGAVSSGYLLTIPLCLAGTCLLEQLAEPSVSPGGSRMILVEEPLHTDLFNHASTQLAWIIERLDYIAEKVGIRYAGASAQFLRGEKRVYYDLGRSRVMKNDEVESQFYGELLDLGSMLHLSDVEASS